MLTNDRELDFLANEKELDVRKTQYYGVMGIDDMEDDFLLMFCYRHKQCDSLFCDRLEAKGWSSMSSNGRGWKVDVKGMCLSKAQVLSRK